MVKTPINSLCPNPLTALDGSHLPFPYLVKMFSQQSIFPKVIPDLGSFPSPPNHFLCISSTVSLTSMHWLGCKMAEPPQPCYVCLFSNFGFFLSYAISAEAICCYLLFLFIVFPIMDSASLSFCKDTLGFMGLLPFIGFWAHWMLFSCFQAIL